MYQHGGDIYQHKNILDFSANINPLGIPEKVLDAAWKGTQLSYYYPDPRCDELREEIARVSKIPKEYIIMGNGAADLIFSLAYGLKPRKALIPVPTFHEYEKALCSAGCEISYYFMKEQVSFTLEEDFLGSITKDLDIIFLCNPNNPTGHLLSRDFLKKVLNQCEECGILLVVDECFIDFIEEPETFSLKELTMNTKNLFILKAFTKTYGIPGLRLGYGYTSNTNLLLKMREATQAWNVSLPAQMAGIAALKEVEYLKETALLIKKERKFLISALKELGFIVYGSKANYIFFHGSKNLYEKCLYKGILIRDCSNYKGLEDGYYRVAVRKHEDNRKLIHIFMEVM